MCDIIIVSTISQKLCSVAAVVMKILPVVILFEEGYWTLGRFVYT